MSGLVVGVVGAGFGAEFVPIYADHPDVAEVIVCEQDPDARAGAARRFPVRTVGGVDELLAIDGLDAVHVVSGFVDHCEHAVRAFEAGMHVASTVPMAMSFDEIDRILAAQRAAGRTYMMMETAVFTREFFYARAMVEAGEIGRPVYARGEHIQDMTAWPSYWRGLPPMYYATHAVSPALALLGTHAMQVRAMGSGRLPADEQDAWGNPFPVETASFTLAGTDVVLDVTRSLSQLARTYTESFAVYGDRGSFEWAQLEREEGPVRFAMGAADGTRGRPVTSERIEAPDRADLLPDPIRKYTQRFVHEAGDHLSFVQGGGHGGSHPHLVHEFVSSIVEGRAPTVDAATAAAWTAAGIAAHESALRGGELVTVPDYSG